MRPAVTARFSIAANWSFEFLEFTSVKVIDYYAHYRCTLPVDGIFLVPQQSLLDPIAGAYTTLGGHDGQRDNKCKSEVPHCENRLGIGRTNMSIRSGKYLGRLMGGKKVSP